MNSINFINQYLEEVKKIADTISKEDINKAIEVLNEARLKNKRIFVIGNGGSASTATHFACDLNKYTSMPGKTRFRVISLEDNVP
ncbi:MAG: SIS domain-containing protein, partial [Nitrosotalea sp.]